MCGLYSYHVCCIAAPWLAKFKTSPKEKRQASTALAYELPISTVLISRARSETGHVVRNRSLSGALSPNLAGICL